MVREVLRKRAFFDAFNGLKLGRSCPSVPTTSTPVAPPPSVTSGDIDLFRVLAERSGEPVESQLQGASMGLAIPDGARIRIAHNDRDPWREGQVIAFLAGSRVMVHRVRHVGRRGPARLGIPHGLHVAGC